MNVNAESYTHYLDRKTAKQVEILEKNKLHINEKCFNEFQKCLEFLKIQAPKSISNPEVSKLLENPASRFCKLAKGRAEIFMDKKNNQYDFCVFSNQYIVNSWDYYVFSGLK